MRLLLTRAAEDAERTRVSLERAGHSVVIAPVIEIVSTGARWPEGVVDAVLATSGHAFDVWPTTGPPGLEARRLMPLLVVGHRTEAKARESGFLGEAHVAATALDLGLALKDIAGGRRLLYLAGRDRKPCLEDALATAGRSFDLIEVYEARPIAKPPSLQAMSTERIEGVLHYSRRSAVLFLEATEGVAPSLRRARHFCLSDDVAFPLGQAGCALLEVASAPNEAALLALTGVAQA